MDTTFDFSGKTALVTGAGSGIGRASAAAFAESGATVIVADIAEAAGQETVGLIEAQGGRAEYRRVDVADEGSVVGLIAAIVDSHGKLDFAHNNAGIEGSHVPMAEIDSGEWRRLMEVNFNSIFYCMKAEISSMLKAGGGAIVNTASVSGLVGGYAQAGYVAAKHAVVGLTKAAAMDYATQGIRINALCPGLVDTPMQAGMPPAFLERILLGTPLGRMARPEEIASATMWLFSDSASYMLGQPLAVDGGVVLGGMGTNFAGLEATR